MNNQTANNPTSINLPLFFNAMQTCEALNISRSTLFRNIKKGSIPHVHIGRRILIPINAIEDLIEKSYQNMKN